MRRDMKVRNPAMVRISSASDSINGLSVFPQYSPLRNARSMKYQSQWYFFIRPPSFYCGDASQELSGRASG